MVSAKPLRQSKNFGTRARYRDMIRVCVAAQKNLCALCNRPFTATWPPTIDHIVAVANGGSHARVNLQAAHAPCNSLKGRMSMWSFRRAIANGRLLLPELPEPEPPEDQDASATSS